MKFYKNTNNPDYRELSGFGNLAQVLGYHKSGKDASKKVPTPTELLGQTAEVFNQVKQALIHNGAPDIMSAKLHQIKMLEAECVELAEAQAAYELAPNDEKKRDAYYFEMCDVLFIATALHGATFGGVKYIAERDKKGLYSDLRKKHGLPAGIAGKVWQIANFEQAPNVENCVMLSQRVSDGLALGAKNKSTRINKILPVKYAFAVAISNMSKFHCQPAQLPPPARASYEKDGKRVSLKSYFYTHHNVPFIAYYPIDTAGKIQKWNDAPADAPENSPRFRSKEVVLGLIDEYANNRFAKRPVYTKFGRCGLF